MAPRIAGRGRRGLLLAVPVTGLVAVVGFVAALWSGRPAAEPLPLAIVATAPVPGALSGFDYADVTRPHTDYSSRTWATGCHEVTTVDTRPGAGRVTGRAHLADAANVVAVEPSTGRAYVALADAGGGRPGLPITKPTAGRR
jgi:hypothetical protein